MRLANKAIAAAALLSVSPLSFAAVYLGGSGLVSAYKYDDTKAGFGGSAFVGYRPETIPMVFEAGYLDTGKNKIDGSVVITGNNTSATVSDSSIKSSSTLPIRCRR